MDRRPLPRRARFELATGVLTAVVHLLPLERFYPEVLEIVALVVGWLGYLGWVLVRDRAEARAMGWTSAHLAPSSAAAALVLVVGAAAAALIGIARGHAVHLHPHMIPLALLYPCWGLIQQWLVLGVVARRLDQWLRRDAARSWTRGVITVLVAAAVFGAVHIPQLPLVVGTFVLGLALTPIYLRWRNLWPLGFVHGWLAIPVYFWMLGEDPWQRVITHT